MLDEIIISKCLHNLCCILGSGEDAGIYRLYDIDKKMFPFIEIFDLKKNSIYNLSVIETEIIRTLIGVWDGGVRQSYKSISERTTIKYQHISDYVEQAIHKFYLSSTQVIINSERNKFIYDNINFGSIRNKILNSSVMLIHLPLEYINLLVNNGFKTIGDLVNIDYEDIIKINKNGKYEFLTIFPRYIVDSVHALGLTFKHENIFDYMYINDKLIKENWESYRVDDIPIWLNYESDVVAFFKFVEKDYSNYIEKIGYQNYKKFKTYFDDIILRDNGDLLDNVLGDNSSICLNNLLCDVFNLKKTKKRM